MTKGRDFGSLVGALGAYLVLVALLLGWIYWVGPEDGNLDGLIAMALTFPGQMLTLPLIQGRGFGFGTGLFLWFGLGALLNCLIVLSIVLLAASAFDCLIKRAPQAEDQPAEKRDAI